MKPLVHFLFRLLAITLFCIAALGYFGRYA